MILTNGVLQMVKSFRIYRYNYGLVFIEQRLITRCRIDDCQPLMGQKQAPMLINPAPVGPTVLQSAIAKSTSNYKYSHKN